MRQAEIRPVLSSHKKERVTHHDPAEAAQRTIWIAAAFEHRPHGPAPRHIRGAVEKILRREIRAPRGHHLHREAVPAEGAQGFGDIVGRVEDGAKRLAKNELLHRGSTSPSWFGIDSRRRCLPTIRR